jgi:TP53 regulating kinase-like protein
MASSRSSEKKETKFNPAPREEWTLLAQGAEARVWKVPGNEGNAPLICKERFSKAYRHPELDARLIKSRTRTEARILEKCDKKSDIRVPKVVRVEKSILYMEFLNGPTLKDHLLKAAESSDDENSEKIDFESLARDMGTLIALLHNLGAIHGDLTTSNILLLEAQELVLIDFGLAKSTTSVEEQAVDLYVLERALQSTHPELPENFFEVFLNTYGEVAVLGSSKKTQTTLKRLEQVRLRGRKRECFG